MFKKITAILTTAIVTNLLALDVTGLYELTSDVTLNEDLHVFPGGVIQPYNGNWSLSVNGNIINEGTIRNHQTIGYQLYVFCSGNLSNTGIITNSDFNMNGSSIQSVHTDPGSPIGVPNFNIQNPVPLKAVSDLYFNSSSITFISGGGFDLSYGYGISLESGYLNNGDLTGQPVYPPVSFLNMTGGAYINESDLTDLSLTGVILTAYNVAAKGSTVNNGVISAAVNAHRTFFTYDTFRNEGTIADNDPYNLSIESYNTFYNSGDVTNYSFKSYNALENNGTFSPSYLYFSGSENANSLIIYYNFPLSPQYIYCTNPNGLSADSDLYFLNSAIEFSDHKINLKNGKNLNIDGGYLYMAYIEGDSEGKAVSNLYMTGESYIQNCVLKNLNLTGMTNVHEGNIFTGEIINSGTMRNISSYTYTLTINGDFENRGIVTDNSGGYSLYIDFNGQNLYNEGTFNNLVLNFSGSSVQNVSCANGKYFSNFVIYSHNTAGIQAISDIYLNSRVEFFNNPFSFTGGRSLYMDGYYLYQASLTADPQTKAVSYLDMNNGAYISACSITNFTLSGIVEVEYSGLSLYGHTEIIGTLQNCSNWNTSINVYGTLTNSGTVRNNPSGYSLDLLCIGSGIDNKGTWSNGYLYFYGSSVQNLSTAYVNPIAASNIVCMNGSGIKAGSDLIFLNCIIDMQNCPLDLTGGYNADINGGLVINAEIKADPALSYVFLSNSAKIKDSTLRDLMLNGFTDLDANVVFEGEILNTGYLQNKPDSFIDLVINGNFRNTGTVQDNTLGWWLNIQAKGNISNHGTWTNNKLDLNGDAHQHITIGYGYSISCPETYFTTNITNDPYEWRYNKTPIAESDPDFSGETIQSLRWLVPVNLDHSGTFYCETGDGASKCVYINNGTFEIPNITSFTNNGMNVSITWDAIPSAAYYRVFSSDDPYKDHNDSSWFCEDENVTTNSWTATVPAGNKKFYFVTAVY